MSSLSMAAMASRSQEFDIALSFCTVGPGSNAGACGVGGVAGTSAGLALTFRLDRATVNVTSELRKICTHSFLSDSLRHFGLVRLQLRHEDLTALESLQPTDTQLFLLV